MDFLSWFRQPKAPEEWIIEYDGRYWNSFSFKKSKSDAMRFRSRKHAEKYAETTFAEVTYEDCSYWREK